MTCTLQGEDGGEEGASDDGGHGLKDKPVS